MKKAMLFVVALFFSISVNAATLSLSAAGSAGASQSVDLSDNAVVLAGGTVSKAGDWNSAFTLSTDVDTPVVIEWSFNPAITAATLVFGAVGSTVSYAITEAFSFTAVLLTGVVYVSSIVDHTSGAVKYDVCVSAFPLQAALFLFEPAVVVFLSFRKNSLATS